MVEVEQRKHQTLGFSTALIQELINNLYNFYGAENWDYECFGTYRNKISASMLGMMNTLLNKVGIYLLPRRPKSVQIGRSIPDFVDGLSFLYDRLEDDYCKGLLAKVIAYRILGYRKVKLPLNTAAYWEKRRKASSLIKSSKTFNISFRNLSLRHFELDDIGYPLRLYSRPITITTMFMQHQYAYSKIPSIRAQEGDCVIDAGGCWGDTALSFAHEVGANGKVYTFEFVPENLEVMTKNIELNPELRERIEIVRNALWNSSNLTMSYSRNGPASSIITDERANEASLGVVTLSIDDFVESYDIPRVDFIKMDIEGAELPALKGARQTINRHKPKLAISVYHSLNDFVKIPQYIESLDTKYKLYLDHYTIFGDETILFALPEKR